MSSVNNTYLQAIVGDYTGDLPEPNSKNEELLKRIAENGMSTGSYETWTFTLEDGSTVTKNVAIGGEANV